MLKDKSIFNWVEELDNQAAERIWGGTMDKWMTKYPDITFIPVEPESGWISSSYDPRTKVGWTIDVNRY